MPNWTDSIQIALHMCVKVIGSARLVMVLIYQSWWRLNSLNWFVFELFVHELFVHILGLFSLLIVLM